MKLAYILVGYAIAAGPNTAIPYGIYTSRPACEAHGHSKLDTQHDHYWYCTVSKLTPKEPVKPVKNVNFVRDLRV